VVEKNETNKKEKKMGKKPQMTHVPRVREKVIVVLCSYFNPSLTQSYTFICVGLCVYVCVCVIIQVLCVLLKGPCPHPPSLHMCHHLLWAIIR